MAKRIYITSVKNGGREELAKRYAKRKGANLVCLTNQFYLSPWAESMKDAKIDENTVFVWDNLEHTQKSFISKFKKFIKMYPKNDIIILSLYRQQHFSQEIQNLLKSQQFEYYYFPDPIVFPMKKKDKEWLMNDFEKDIFNPPDISNIKEQVIFN